jgi:hypothetical protein
MTQETNDTRPEIDLHDVLKERVEQGKPIYITSQPGPQADALIEGLADLAEEAGKTVQVVQVIDLAKSS